MRKRNSYSRIIQNVAGWGSNHTNFRKGKIINLLHDCVEHSITSFNCTDYFGNHVDRTFGTALSESGLSRDQIQLIGKFRTSEGAKDLVSGVDELLLDLKTDYLDLLLLEMPTQPERLKDDMEKLISQAKIKEIGGSNFQEQELQSFRETAPILANQLQLDLFSEAGKRSLQSISSTSEEIIQIIYFDLEKAAQETSESSVLKEIAAKYNLGNFQLLPAWLLQHSMHLHLEISSAEEEELSMLTAAKEVQLTTVDWQKINLLLS
ncbi:hypothetical protein GCM10007103_00620 [Salinimicrobium marinum]|uniref:NADP-dependent oxidoreductase domain-containing protein n=1 Tax=Salinimicrobium marinum TaxID=680283 RepID=A0A918S6S9_9FLAO|nr:aldo/keto reductase [Salinimicrobium marinum]GHA23456.1 hypothetical protein GCM10007103_00620 [Salinimicrobium marinum]